MALLKIWGCGLACLLLLAWFTPSDAYPNPEQRYFNYENSSPEELMDLYYRINNLLRMERNIENEKRGGLDLGLNRGYSGSLQAKHLMALAAANDAGGPGRKRRQADY